MISYLFTDGESFRDGLEAMTRNVLSQPASNFSPKIGGFRRSKLWTDGYDAGYRAATSEAGAIAATVPFRNGGELAFAFDAIASRVRDSGAAIMLHAPAKSLKTLEGWHAGFAAGMENASYVARAAEFQATGSLV